MKPLVFSVRSVSVGIATATIVAAALGQLVGAPWGLAILTGFAAGACALAVPITVRDGRFDVLGTSAVRRHRGIWLLAYSVVILPMFFIDDVVALSRPDGLALTLLFGLTGMAAYVLGGITATLNHLEGDDIGDDPRLHQVSPSRGNGRSSS